MITNCHLYAYNNYMRISSFANHSPIATCISYVLLTIHMIFLTLVCNLSLNYLDYVTDVVIEAIRLYFELSAPASANTTLNMITRQLDNIQRSNEGSNFRARMRELFSYSYLERMRGLYDLSSNGDYHSSFVDCALEIIEQNQISDEVTSAIDVMEHQFRSLYYVREILFSIYIVFFNLESNLPFISCVRSFAELSYCRICLPETAPLFPCRNVCKNVLSGCTIFLHVTGEEIINPLRVLCQLNTMTSHPSWNLRTALEVINNKLYSIFDTSIRDLLQIASSVSFVVLCSSLKFVLTLQAWIANIRCVLPYLYIVAMLCINGSVFSY